MDTVKTFSGKRGSGGRVAAIAGGIIAGSLALYGSYWAVNRQSSEPVAQASAAAPTLPPKPEAPAPPVAEKTLDEKISAEGAKEIALTAVASYFCKTRNIDKQLIVSFNRRNMTQNWAGIVYAVPKDVDLTKNRYLHIRLRQHDLRWMRVEAQSAKTGLGHTYRQRIGIPDNTLQEETIDLHALIDDGTMGADTKPVHITELKLIVDGAYIIGNAPKIHIFKMGLSSEK